MSDVDSNSGLRLRAAAKVAKHELPSPDQTGGVGRAGSGEKCCVCELEIQKCRNEKPTIEYEIEWQKAGRISLLRFHSECFRAWVSLAGSVNANNDVTKPPG